MASVSRRDFLSIAGLGVIGGLVGASPEINTSIVHGSRTYQGVNLAGWTALVGDGVRGTVTPEDIETTQFSNYSEVRANIQSRPEIMAHNLSIKKVIDNSSFDYVHACQYQ